MPLSDQMIPRSRRSTIVVIELAVFLALVAAMGGAIVKVYEWRQDVLYGPYCRRDDRFDIH